MKRTRFSGVRKWSIYNKSGVHQPGRVPLYGAFELEWLLPPEAPDNWEMRCAQTSERWGGQ